MQKSVHYLRQLIEQANYMVILTGAGISTESGIPDFRSPGGLWEQFRIIEYDEYMASEEARIEDWRRRIYMQDQIGNVSPNLGHRKIAEWLNSGKVKHLITQNIDGLHQKAGSPEDRIIEIHGNATTASCTACGLSNTINSFRIEFEKTGKSPKCPSCYGIIKTDVVMFGEAMPKNKTNAAFEIAEKSDLFIAIGTSLVVQPAASLPLHAKRNGAKIAIINRDPTDLDKIADCAIHDEIGNLFSSL